MQRLEVSGAVRPICVSLSVKRLNKMSESRLMSGMIGLGLAGRGDVA